MEEEKKVSEQEKVEQEQKTEALLEPRPYKRKAEPEDTATDSKDTSSEE